LAAFIVNAMSVLFSRRSVPVQIIAMTLAGAIVTGGFLLVATVYLVGRQEGEEQAKPDPASQPPEQKSESKTDPPPPDSPKHGPPDSHPDRPPSHVARAKKNGSSALDDGPAEVTALALAPDNNTLAVGYADGTVYRWKFDASHLDSWLPGPKADGPVTRL